MGAVWFACGQVGGLGVRERARWLGVRGVDVLLAVGLLAGCAPSGEFVVSSGSAGVGASPESQSQSQASPPVSDGGDRIVSGSSNPLCPSSVPDPGVPSSFEPSDVLRDKTGSGLRVSVQVRSGADCLPLPGVRVQVWHEGPQGEYAPQFRSVVVTDELGRFIYRGPRLKVSAEADPHVHFLVELPDGVFPVTVGVPAPVRVEGRSRKVQQWELDVVVPGPIEEESLV